MTRGTWFLALFLIFLAAACTEKSSPTGAVADTPANRKAAAARYLAAVPTRELLQNTMGNMAQRLPEPTRKVFLETLADKDLLKAANRISETALVKYFTPDELNAMTAFFGSPAGKSARNKFSPYMHDLMPQINAEVKKVFTKLQKQTKAKEPKEGEPQAAQPKAAPPKPAPSKAEPPQAPLVKPAQPEKPQPKPEQPKAQQPQPEKPKSR